MPMSPREVVVGREAELSRDDMELCNAISVAVGTININVGTHTTLTINADWGIKYSQ